MGLAEFLTASASWIFPALLLAWLAVCAWLDWRRRQVPNALTLPAILLAFGIRLAGLSVGPWPMALGLCLAGLAFWRFGLAGGADAKATLVLALLDTRLAVWAWAGAAAWCLLLWVYTRGRQGPYRLPGFLGFFAGGLAYGVWLWLR